MYRCALVLEQLELRNPNSGRINDGFNHFAGFQFQRG